MALFKHIVETELKFVTRNGKKVEESTRQINQLGHGVQQMTSHQKKWDKQGKENITTTDRTVRGFQRFQMEQLGVMFAGMALNRAMANLNATSREWLGIGELMDTMMGVTMLQSNMDLLNFGVLPLFDALINLPPEAQKALGYISLGLEGAGAAMMTGGQFALGINSMITMIQKLGFASLTTKGLLLGLGGIGLIGIGVTLAIGSITSEGGTSVLMALGAGLAVALGTVLLGASVVGGIALGTIVVTGLLLYQMASQMAEQSKAYDALGTDIPLSETPNISEAIRMRGTRMTTNTLSPELQAGVNGVNMNVNYNVNVSDKVEFEEMLKKNNSELTADVRRMTQA